jgi:hypothetical protein
MPTSIHEEAQTLRTSYPSGGLDSPQRVFFLKTIQFIRTYLGTKNEFYRALDNRVRHGSTSETHAYRAKEVLDAVIEFYGGGLSVENTVIYRIQGEVVSDMLEQSGSMLNHKDVHPAASIILCGAALEEFLRLLCTRYAFDVSEKPTIDTYTKKLREEDKIEKQDAKDITSWAGLRNDAAHGHFEKVNDRQRAALMIEGVNLFMRKYSA